jgi:hypothetical protein
LALSEPNLTQIGVNESNKKTKNEVKIPPFIKFNKPNPKKKKNELYQPILKPKKEHTQTIRAIFKQFKKDFEPQKRLQRKQLHQ